MNLLKKFNKTSRLKLIFIIFLIGLFIFSNMLGNSFVWDDEEMVVKNFSVFQIKNIPVLFKQATFFSGGSSLSGWFYRPLVMISFLLTRVFFGESPVGFHLVQLALHIASASLVFVIFNLLFERKNSRQTKLVSFLLALVFLVHSASVEAVTYVASIAEPLYTLFLLVVLLLIIKTKKITPKVKFFAGFSFFLALLTKEGAIVFLVLVPLYLYFFKKKELKEWTMPLGLGFLGYLVTRFSFFGIQLEKPNFLSPIAKVAFSERLLTLPHIFFSFLKTFLFPKELSISQHMVVKSPVFANFWLPLIISLAFLGLVAFFVVKTKNKLATFFFAWFIFSIFPVLNLVFPLDMTFAERWLYFPMIGLLGLIGSFIREIKNKNIRFYIFVPLLVLSVALLSHRTVIRNCDWKDGITLYAHDIKLNPESFDLQNNLGVELFRKGEDKKALEHFEKSVELEPNWAISLNNLGVAYERQNDVKKARQYYQRAVENGNYYLAYENFASLLLKENGPEDAIEFLKKALLGFPNNGKLNRLLAMAYYSSGKQNLAVVYAKKAYELNPNRINSYVYQTILEKKELDI